MDIRKDVAGPGLAEIRLNDRTAVKDPENPETVERFNR